MTPRRDGILAGLANNTRENGVAEQALTLVQFTGIHIGFAGIAGTVDQKSRFRLTEQSSQYIQLRVIVLRTAQIAKRDAVACQVTRKGRADVARSAKKKEHKKRNLRDET